MKINQNNDISVYRGETAAIHFKLSQRSDYYVPFLVNIDRVNPMICITIGSTRRESNNIVSKQLWLPLSEVTTKRFNQTVVEDLGTITFATPNDLSSVKAALLVLATEGIMYKYLMQNEVDNNTPKLHFAYVENNTVIIDEYEFTVIMALDETITLDMTNTDYYYQIELMNTEPMTTAIFNILTANPTLINKLPTNFVLNETGIDNYYTDCINVITKAFPNQWGYRINNPYTSPVASVSNIQMLQPPRKFTVESVIK